MKKYRLKLIMLAIIILIIQSCQNTPTNGNKEYKYSNGQTQFFYTYKNGLANGPYKAFYRTGVLWAEGNYINDQLSGPFKTYTPEGKLAVEKEYNRGRLMYQKVYWQETADDKFLFVSNEGFIIMKNGKYITLDSSTPDNIIEEKRNIETGEIELYIWSNGQKILYKPKTS